MRSFSRSAHSRFLSGIMLLSLIPIMLFFYVSLFFNFYGISSKSFLIALISIVGTFWCSLIWIIPSNGPWFWRWGGKDIKRQEKIEKRNRGWPKKSEYFMINAQTLLITYKLTPVSWSLDFVKEKLIDEILTYKRGESRRFKTRVVGYLITEKIFEEANKHVKEFNCLIELREKIKILDPNYLDIESKPGIYTPIWKTSNKLLYEMKQNANYIEEGIILKD